MGQISHDLRTPLNAIIILLNLVVKDVGEISDRVKKEYLFPALQNSKYLLVLLNDILDFTQEEFNKEPRLVFETVNVKDIIETIKVTLQMKAKIRKIDLLTEIDEKIPREFNTDPRRLTQILMNLVGNAMKFTFKGYVKIKVELLTI